MLQFLKEKIFGFKTIPRAGSVDNTSKVKRQEDPKKPLSIDSKRKDEEMKTAEKKRVIVEIDELDQMYSVKGDSNRPSQLKEKQGGMEDLGNIFVSEQRSQSDNYENLLSGLEDIDSLDSTSKQKNLINNTNNDLPKRKQIFPNIGPVSCLSPKREPGSMLGVKQDGKILVKKTESRKQIRKIHEICAVCKKIVKKAESLQLACTHRYHRACGVMMQWKMQYKCDICSFGSGKIAIKYHK